MHLKELSLFAGLIGSAYAQGMAMSLNATLARTSELSSLAGLLGQVPQLVQALSTLKNITILAPSNAAFKEFMKANDDEKIEKDDLTALLQYHVLKGTYLSTDITKTPAFVPSYLSNKDYSLVSGGQVVEAATMGKDVVFTSGLLTQSTVQTADVKFTGGVIHIIDKVLMIPESASDTAVAADLTALAGAVEQLDLGDTVDDTPNLTIFAPNNDAFQAIASGVKALSTKDLTSILSYHVVKGTVGYSSDLTDGMSLKTLEGDKVTITIENGEVFVNSARVVMPDVLVENGVVHVIDNVLNPEETMTPKASATSGTVAFTGVSSAKNIPFTSGITQSTSLNTAAATGNSGGSKTDSGNGVPMKTAEVAMAALFGVGAAMAANY